MKLEEYSLPHLINYLHSNSTRMLTLSRDEARSLLDIILDQLSPGTEPLEDALDQAQADAQDGTDQLLILKIQGL